MSGEGLAENNPQREERTAIYSEIGRLTGELKGPNTPAEEQKLRGALKVLLEKVGLELH